MPKQFVVLLHGILRSKTDMLPLALYLKKRGYQTLNILYPSRKKTLEDITDFVHEKIQACTHYDDSYELHFVTHSMGGLIARYYIEHYKPQNLGKVVMLSPPNSGSDFADILDNHELLSGFYNAFFGPAGKQLRTDYEHNTGEIYYPLGVIAGTQSINPLALWGLPIKKVGMHDGIVPVERTKIAGMSDHLTLPVNHTFMMFDPKVMEQVKFFLETGKFFKDHTRELVILLHGIANPAFIMEPMAHHLKQYGYHVLNVEYPSQSESVARLTKYVHRALIRKKYNKFTKVHFVAFSLGGLVLRAYLSRLKPGNLGRVVMIGTPNNGSEVAAQLKERWFYKNFFGPAGQEIGTDARHPYSSSPVDFELGVIAGTNNSMNFAEFMIDEDLPEPNDGAVSVESTKITGMKDHITVNAPHALLINDNFVKDYTVKFLLNGAFTATSENESSTAPEKS